MATNNQIVKQESANNQLIANPELEAVSWSAVRQELGLAGEQVEAKRLIDSTFTIIRARQFESTFQEGEHAYFCVIKPSDAAEVYTVTLGGGAVVEVLDEYIKSGINRPLKVTLRFKEGGRYNGYYFFE